MTLRVGIYARYSTNKQRPKSISDQVRECRDLLKRMYPKTRFDVEEYKDAAISGAFDANREDLMRLMRDVKARRLDVVVTENTDRLGRDGEFIERFQKQLRFADVRLLTVQEGGEPDSMTVSLKGMMGAQYLKTLAIQVRRTLKGNVLDGKFVGTPPYGYDKPSRGGRAINQAEAATVRRIYTEYAAGVSAQAIARQLNADGVAGPGGRVWTQVMINGNAKGGRGVLNNELYVGRYVWNRSRKIKHPDTGNRVARLNPPDQWAVRDVPDLRIVSDEQWRAVRDKQAEWALKIGPTCAFRLAKRPKHLFSGRVTCAACKRHYVTTGGWMYCDGHRHGICAASKSIPRHLLEARVQQALQARFSMPEAEQAFTKFYNELLAEESAKLDAVDVRDIERQIAANKKASERLVALVADGLGGVASVKDKLLALHAEGQRLERERVRATEPKPTRLRVHPKMKHVLATKIQTLFAALHSDDADAAKARESLRGIVQEIRLARDARAENGVAVTIFASPTNLLSAVFGPENGLNTYTPMRPGPWQRLCVIAA